MVVLSRSLVLRRRADQKVGVLVHVPVQRPPAPLRELALLAVHVGAVAAYVALVDDARQPAGSGEHVELRQSTPLPGTAPSRHCV